MQTCLFKEDQEPMLKQEFNFEDMAMYLEEEDHEAFIKVENEESIKEMIVAENRVQTPPRPRQRWRNNAIVNIERQPDYDRIFTREAKTVSTSAARKRVNTIINPYHPQHHCAKCDKFYFRQGNFRRHIKAVHCLNAKNFEHPHATIDPYNPQHYCAKCDKSYPGAYFYRHLRRTHDLHVEIPKPSRAIHSRPYTPGKHRGSQKATMAKRIKRPQPTITRIFKPQGYCAKCDCTYSTKSKLLLHLKKEHGNKPQFMYPNAEIDVLDPKNHCAKCDRKYPNASKFFAHLQDQHKSTLYNIRDAVKISSKRNPTYYCPKCDRYYTEEIFRQHFVNHRASRPVIVNPDAEVDMTGPDFYCSRCEHCYSSRETFRSHVTQIHGLSFEWTRAMRQKRVVYPDAEIDFNGSDGFCAKCDKKLTCKKALRVHAANVHGIHPPPLSGEPVEHGAYSLRNGKKLTPIFR